MNPLALYELATTTLDCVCAAQDALQAELAVDGIRYGCACVSMVSPAPPVWDSCCDDCEGTGGQLTVHIADVFASTKFPEPAQAVFPCAPVIWVAQLVVTSLRCIPSVSETGQAPSPEAIAESARTVSIDTMAILQAVTCCLTEGNPPKRKRRVSVSSVNPTSGDDAGCTGVEVTILVEAGLCVDCVESS